MSARFKGYITLKIDKEWRIPLFITPVQAGIPVRVDEPVESELNLIDFLIKHPASTFGVPVSGDSMVGASISEGDILIVDSSLEPNANDIVVVLVDDECTVKRLRQVGSHLWLVPDNKAYKGPQRVQGQEGQTLGVVTYKITSMRGT